MDGNIWKLKFRTNSHISSIGTLVPDRNGFITDINNSSKSKTINMNESDPFDSPVLSRDPSVIQEILNKVEDQYYSMTFDSGKFEIESLAGPSCRELTKMKLRLLLLDRQNKAVSRRVSELVLEKHPMYEAELNGVLSLQSDNWETLALCRRIRRSLKMSDHALVYSRLMVLRNFRRLLRLRRVLRILRQIRVLQQNVQMLDTLLTERNFHAAIELHRESLVLLEDYRQYRCVEPIHVKLHAFGMRIEDLLDSELQMNCDHFSEQSYFTVQQAFELLGSTQTTFAQLHMHYIASIQRRTLTIVQSFVPPIDKDSEQSCASRDYSELCLRLPLHSIHLCLQRVCQSLWLTLLCYHQTVLWHQQRACGKRPKQQTGSVCRSSGFSSLEPGSDVDSHQSPRSSGSRHDLMRSRVNRPNGNFGRNSDISDEEEDEGDVIENGLRTDRNDERSARAADSNDNQSQLFRQWHDYVASKLTASRPRIWTEVSGRVEAILRCVGQFATEMQFDQISSVLKTVNHLVTIGEEFCGSLSTDLQEVLRTSIYKFFRDFHRKHMERLKMFLESETWESCPVKSSFTVMDLQEYRALINLLQNSEPKKQVTTMPLDHNSPRSLTSQLPTVSEKRLFDAPYEEHQFPVPADSTTPGSQSMDGEPTQDPSVGTPTRSLLDRARQKIESPLVQRIVASSSGEALSGRQKSPLLSNTTLEVLRLIGRYLQMMHLLQPIAGEVMHSVRQMFDYYLYSIFIFFGPVQLLDSTDLPERLSQTLKRISERLIAEDGHPSVLKGDRFALPENEPMHVLHSISRFQEATACTDKSTPGLWIAFLQAHLVGVESVIYLADILEQILLPYLSMCIPEHKRGITVVFREQSLLAARQLREPCALQTVPLLINLMLPSSGQGYSLGPMGSTSATIASLGKLWPLTTTGHSSSTSNRPDSAVVRTTTDTVESNPLVPLVRAVNWGSKQMATVPNAYINRIHSQVLTPFASGLQLTTQRFGLSEANRTMLWTKMLTCIADYLVNAYGHVHVCSEEGRGQMLLDVRSLRDLAESVCKIRPFPKLDHVIEYIQAFYIPAHEWEHWVTQTGIKFSKAQLIGLAHCLARGDRRLRQRLLNTVNQVYGNSASSNNNSSTNNANTNNNAIPALNYNATVLGGSMSTSTG